MSLTASWALDFDLEPARLEPVEPTCDECGEPGELSDGLCHRCRCHGCGDPAAPVEHRGGRWCRLCAREVGWSAPLALVFEAVE